MLELPLSVVISLITKCDLTLKKPQGEILLLALELLLQLELEIRLYNLLN